MTDFPALLYTSTCEIPTLLYTRSLKKVNKSARPQRQTNTEGCRIFGDLDQLKSKDTMQKTVD